MKPTSMSTSRLVARCSTTHLQVGGDFRLPWGGGRCLLAFPPGKKPPEVSTLFLRMFASLTCFYRPFLPNSPSSFFACAAPPTLSRAWICSLLPRVKCSAFPGLSVHRFRLLYVFLRNGRFCESGTSYCLRVFSPPPPPSPQVFVRVSPRIPLHVLSHTFGCLPYPRLVYGTSKTWSLSAFPNRTLFR